MRLARIVTNNKVTKMKRLCLFIAYIPVIFIIEALLSQNVIKNEVIHTFVCTDYTEGKVFINSAEGKLECDYPAENCNDIWILPNGSLPFNTGKAHYAFEITREKNVIWVYDDFSFLKAMSGIQLLDLKVDTINNNIWC
jgi:hypothetical protein